MCLLAVSESWMMPTAHDAIAHDAAPDDYQIVHVPRADGRRGGGLAVIHRRSLDTTSLHISAVTTSFEAQGLRLTVAAVLNVYRAPSGSIDTFVDELSVVIDELLDSGCRLLLMGDFNCPGTTSTCVDDRLTMLLSEYGLRPVNSQPTRYNPQTGTENMLDILIESEDDDSALHSVVTRSVTFSDHRAVVGKLRLKRPPAPVVSFRQRDLKNVDMSALRLHLASSPLVTAPSDDPDECMDSFIGDTVAALDKEVPVRNFCRRCSRVANRWLSSEATEAKRESRRLERKFTRLRTTQATTPIEPPAP